MKKGAWKVRVVPVDELTSLVNVDVALKEIDINAGINEDKIKEESFKLLKYITTRDEFASLIERCFGLNIIVDYENMFYVCYYIDSGDVVVKYNSKAMVKINGNKTNK
jgi:hypothetical protein